MFDSPEPESELEEDFGPNKEKEVASLTRISIPLVRRIYPQLIADKIVSVQPMSTNTFNPTSEVEKKKKKKIWRSIEDDWQPSIYE